MLTRPFVRARVVAGDEAGGVLVMVAVWLPALLLLAVFVLDVGNWFVHKRHLQMQADAGALAAAGSFRIPCDDTAIITDAHKYAGYADSPLLLALGTAAYNEQVSPDHQGDVHVLINSEKFWNEGGVDFSDGGTPCLTRFIDVKATESELPLFFSSAIPGLSAVPAVNAHARVEIRARATSVGALPIAVPDVNPQYVFATFVDESTGSPLAGCADSCTVALAEGPTTDGMTMWSNVGSPFSVPIGATNIGVRLRLVGGSDATLQCGESLVECYDKGSANGLVHVRGWASASPPAVRDAWLLSGTCAPDGYFATATCTTGVQAVVDLGNRDLTGDGVTTNVWATVNGKNTKYQLTLDPDAATTGPATWTRTSDLPNDVAGRSSVELHWSWEKTTGTWEDSGTVHTCTSSGTNPCKGNGTFGPVQYSFLAHPDRSGPVKLLQVGESGVSVAGANSFEIGTTHDLVVSVGIEQSLKAAADASDPTVILRVAGPSGSQNQAVDCDAGVTLRDELAYGCKTPYQKNKGQACPNLTLPADCVPIETGDKVGQVKDGMNTRFADCPPNNWASYPNLPQGDPRAITVILVPFGSFSGQGNGYVPVADFATFYATGWHGDTCADNEPFPGTGSESGSIWGHFIRYVHTLNDGGAGEELCDLSSMGNCIAVLTE